MALLLCGALTNTFSVFAQSSKSTPSRVTVSTGIGLFPTYYKSDEGKGVPPLNLMLGYDITKNFGIAAFMGYSTTKSSPDIFSENENSSISNKTKVLGLRFSVKKELNDKFSFYGGGMFSYFHADVKEIDKNTKALVVRPEGSPTPFNPNAKKGKLTYTAFFGSSLKVAKRVSLFAEIGYGISVANLGITVRI
ncbi:MAG: outer membrane beta-barrel protein [Saprospiraceae bacterium]|nr:outer membrane beta-barrel protein [Saprospiraceae bacterium]